VLLQACDLKVVARLGGGGTGHLDDLLPPLQDLLMPRPDTQVRTALMWHRRTSCFQELDKYRLFQKGDVTLTRESHMMSLKKKILPLSFPKTWTRKREKR
jgi:hypothetical protein